MTTLISDTTSLQNVWKWLQKKTSYVLTRISFILYDVDAFCIVTMFKLFIQWRFVGLYSLGINRTLCRNDSYLTSVCAGLITVDVFNTGIAVLLPISLFGPHWATIRPKNYDVYSSHVVASNMFVCM